MTEDTLSDLWTNLKEQGYLDYSFVKKWMKLWNMRVLEQDHYGLIMGFRGISCWAMKNNIFLEVEGRYLDLRIPFIYFSVTGSGKGEGVDIYDKMFTKFGLKIDKLQKPTIQRVEGSVNVEMLNKVKKNETDAEKQERFKKAVIPGLLEEYDDLIFDEGKIYFENSDYANELLRIIRVAVDNFGTKGNLIKAGDTLKNAGISGLEQRKYHCKCNVCFLSHHVSDKEFLSKETEQGTFQRCITFFYTLTTEQQNRIIEGVHTTTEEYEKQFEQTYLEIKSVFDFIKTFRVNSGFMKIEKEAERFIKDQLIRLNTENQNTDEMRNAQSFLTRMKPLTYKIAGVIALSKKKTTVTIDDAYEAYAFVKMSFQQIVSEIVVDKILKEENKTFLKDIKNILGKKSIKKQEFVEAMQTYWGCSLATVYNRIDKIKSFFNHTKSKDGIQYISLK